MQCVYASRKTIKKKTTLNVELLTLAPIVNLLSFASLYASISMLSLGVSPYVHDVSSYIQGVVMHSSQAFEVLDRNQVATCVSFDIKNILNDDLANSFITMYK